MRVVIAPDKFAGTLSAVEAAEAIADGWRRRAPEDTLSLAPMADGGPGFVDVLHAALGGELSAVTVPGPLGAPVPAMILRHGDTVYVESAQACGPELIESPAASHASTSGVGHALMAALDMRPARIVVGLGGSATNDAGAGMLHVLGARADVPLDRGPDGLAGVRSVELDDARSRLESVDLVVASDVDTTLLGMFGATRTYGPQKGLGEDDIQRIDAVLDRFVVAACGTTPADRRPADTSGSGAAGGLGFALLALGGTVRSGIELVAQATRLPEAARDCDLVVTGEGSYDFSSRSGKVVYGVARIAGEALRPCIVLAGSVLVGAREMRAMGVESAYSVDEHTGPGAAQSDPAGRLSALAERVARTWSR